MQITADIDQRSAVLRALGEPTRLRMVDALDLGDLTPGELACRLDLPLNLVTFHVTALEAAGVVRRVRSEGDRRRRYVHLRHGVLERVGVVTGTGADVPRFERLLFVCSLNAARSQIAAALWLGRTGRPAQSAGREPARTVHPLAVAVAGSRGVDLSAARPHGFEAVAVEPDLVVTLCDRALESGTPFEELPRLHWSIPDPVRDGRPGAFARAYDAVAERIEHLAQRTA